MTTLVGLVHTGDSIGGNNTLPSYFHQAYGWTGRGDSTTPTMQKRAIYYNGNIIATNMAIAGTRLNTNGYPDLVPMALIDIDPMIPVGYAVPPNDRARKYILTCAIGSSDGAIGGTTPVLYAASVASCCNLRRTAGFNKLGMCTLLPRNDAAMTEANRLAYNAELTRAGFLAEKNIDFIIDLASQAVMGDPASCNNATYYEQVTKVHPTAAGHLLLAPIYKAAVDAQVALL